MYCSTCGALIPSGRRHCDTCGTALAPRLRPAPPADTFAVPERSAPPATGTLPVCPRCGYHGEGLGYFSRGSHLAGLVGFTLLTAGAVGVGGLIYYLVRREHLVCPRCGNGWGKHGVRAMALAAPARPGVPEAPAVASWVVSAQQGWAIALFVLAAVLAVAGIVATEVGPLMAAGVAAAGGLVAQRAAERERERRRGALLSSLQLPVLRLAAQRGGRLTVTEVAAELGWPLPRAEKVLQSLDDDLRVSSEVTDEGVIVYRFRELIHSGERLPRPEP